MPSFPNLNSSDVTATSKYILSGENEELESVGGEKSNPRYRFTGYHKFLDPDGYPAVAPPWGTLNAAIMRGRSLWESIRLWRPRV